MALQRITYSATQFIPVAVGCCPTVYLCLGEVFATRTVSGLPLIEATVEAGRFLGSAGYAFGPRFENNRCEEEYQYTIVYDDAQMLNDPETELPYPVLCSDIVEVNPYVCTIDALLAAIAAPPTPTELNTLFVDVTQAAHGFPAPTFPVPLLWDSGAGDYVPAQADALANAAQVLLFAVPGVDTLRVQQDGTFVGAHGLTVGEWYYLSPSVAGEVVLPGALVPGDYSQRLFFVVDATHILADLQEITGPL